MALKTPIIHCLFDAEPDTFHPVDPSLRTLAVNLGFECLTDIAPADVIGESDPAKAKQAELKNDESAAQALFAGFVDATQNIRFHLFEAHPDDKVFLTYIGEIADQISDVAAPNAAADVTSWLGKAAPAETEFRHYWTTPGEGTTGETTMDATGAPATYRLRAAHSWNAPVAHRLGLTHLLRVEGVADDKHYVILPFSAGILPPASLTGTSQGILWDFLIDAGGAFGLISCRTEVLTAPHSFTAAPETVSDFLNPEGYLKVDEHAEALWRITKWFEARAASLMAPAAALAGPAVGAEDEHGKDDDYSALFVWRYTKEDPLVLNAPAPAWLAATSLCAALDDTIIAIMKPISGNTAIGDILAPLVFTLSERLEKDVANTFELAEDSYGLSKLAGILRTILANHNPLIGAPDLADPVARERFCKCLRDVHGISALPESPVEDHILTLLLSSFATGAAVTIDSKLWLTIKGKALSILHRALADTQQRLQDETGAETAIIRLFETTEKIENAGGVDISIKFPALFARAFSEDCGRSGEAALETAVVAVFSDAWRDYGILLQSAFNGAEAVRRSAASEFTKALLTYDKTHGLLDVPAPRRLIEAATGADYCAQRILGLTSPTLPGTPAGSTECFRPIADSLVRPPFPVSWPDGFAPVAPADLLPFFLESYRAALAPIEELVTVGSRFIPDTAPTPLPIQIAVNVDGQEIGDFAKHFNGIAIAIRRVDAGGTADRWAHASLAELTWPAPPPDAPVTVPAAIHPLLPAVSDGRGPMFIEYEGLPLAAKTFDKTAADAIAETPDAFVPFYKADAPDLESSAFTRIPRLAYGRAFQTFSFATTNAGSLPLALQADLPWMPEANFAPPEKLGDPQLVLTTKYQRRTAIGQIAVNEKPAANKPRRIAVPVDGVVPLAEDYPRTVVSTQGYPDKGHPGVRDLFRNRDGAGTLSIHSIPQGKIEWHLTDVAINGRPRRLVVRLFGAAPKSPIDTGAGTLRLKFPPTFDFGAVNKITFGIETGETGTGHAQRYFYVTCGNATERVALNTTAEISDGWIRLAVMSDTPASLSFAATDSAKPHEAGAPLLLLAPDDAWKSGLSAPVTVDIDTPRVGYLDFERWFSNADLRDAAFDAKTNDENRKAYDALRRALLTAYVLRDADEDLARLLDRLPDPAVDAVRIELAVQDQISDTSLPLQSASKDIGLDGKLLTIAQDIAKEGSAVSRWSPELLKLHIFTPIEREFRFSLSLKPGNFSLFENEPNELTATVPAGTVALLSLDALVPHRHFKPLNGHPAVFHHGLKQHAARMLVPEHSKEQCLAYASAALRIETMWDGMYTMDATDKTNEAQKPAIALAAEMIAVRPIERSRRYDLQTRAGFSGTGSEERTRHWRLLGEIDVTSQRWRPSGRPIYHHIAPSHFRDDAALSAALSPNAAHAAMPLREMEEGSGTETRSPLYLFEEEAFFDRPNIDSQTVTQRLLPLPAVTVLQQHVWDAPSATYFRHRFTLRSRYAGALKDLGKKEIKAWITDRKQRKTPPDAWTLRVAMLAELSRMLLTRPQQRALIPLTTAPRNDGEMATTPPVLAILQEPPFSRGGLADRIAAEIKTGFGYGFASKGAATVEILDSRKEIGPDPRLTYRSLDAEAALGMALNAEGPIGLTFDAVSAPAPAFPNSMVSLSPVSLVGARRNLEEHFLGISMRRYIDPNWTIASATPNTSGLDAERCWWFDCAAARPHEVLNLLNYTADGVVAELLTLQAEDGDLVVKTLKAAVDGGIAGASEKDVVIARWRADFTDRLTILHQPVAPGRYSTSVFVLPANDHGNVTLGESNAPLLVCNFEWGPPKKVVTTDAEGKATKTAIPVTVTLNAQGATVRPTMASAPTFLAWTRTGRDFDTVHSQNVTGAPETRKVAVRDLLANLDDTSSTLTFDLNGIPEQYWLCSSTLQKPFPLHVQRHLAVLTTRYLREPGRPVEAFRRTALLVGRRSARLASEGKDDSNDEDCLRIVEFETPASILCGTAGTVPETYKRAYFDLVSTGFAPSRKNGVAPGEIGGAASARLFFRFTGQRAHLTKFTKLTVGVRFSEKDADRHSVPIPFGSPPAGAYAIAVELFLERASQAGALTYRPVLLYSNGDRSSASPVTAPNALGLRVADSSNPGFFLDIQAEGSAGAGEFWTDVSLLHSPRPTFEPRFDFNWLFSQAGGTEPALDVSQPGLNTMVEAQARIVSVSPPIPVSTTPKE